jgi:hypothetical protein
MFEFWVLLMSFSVASLDDLTLGELGGTSSTSDEIEGNKLRPEEFTLTCVGDTDVDLQREYKGPFCILAGVGHLRGTIKVGSVCSPDSASVARLRRTPLGLMYSRSHFKLESYLMVANLLILPLLAFR